MKVLKSSCCDEVQIKFRAVCMKTIMYDLFQETDEGGDSAGMFIIENLSADRLPSIMVFY